MKNNNDGFTVVKPKHKEITNSGLYNFLTSYDQTWISHTGLTSQQVTSKLEAGYLIIGLDISKIPAQDMLTPIEWHIRIDKTYSFKRHFFAQWHHTLKYTNKKTGVVQTLRAYYNNGVFLCIKIDDDDLCENHAISRLNTHTTYAKDTVLMLLGLLQKAQQTLQESFDTECAKLYTEQASNLNTEQINTIYARCEKLFQQLITINEDMTKMGIIALANRVAVLKQRREELQPPAALSEELVQTTQEHVAPAVKNKTKNKHQARKISPQILKDLNDELNTIRRHLNSRDYTAIIEAHDSIREFETRILSYYKSYPDSKNHLDDFFLNISTLDDLNKVFLRLVNDKEYAIAQQLHAAGFGIQPSEYYGNLVGNTVLLNSLTEKNEVEFIQFCKYLYENSENYRIAVSVIFNHLPVFTVENVSIGMNVLTQLAAVGKMGIFKLFYEQLKSNTIVAYRCGNRANDLLNAILCFKHNDYDLIEYLLDQEHPTEYSTDHCSYILQKSLESKRSSFRVVSSVQWRTEDVKLRNEAQTLQLMHARDLVAVPSAFYHGCVNYSKNLTQDKARFAAILKNFADNSSIPYLTLGLSTLLLKAERYVWIPVPGISSLCVYADRAVRDSKISEHVSALQLGKKCKSLSCLVLESQDEILFDLIRYIVILFNKRVEEMNDKQKYTLHIDLGKLITSEMNLKQSQPVAASYNALNVMYFANILSATLLPQTAATFKMLQKACTQCLQHYEAMTNVNTNNILSKQTTIENSTLAYWVQGYQNLVKNLEELKFWHDELHQQPGPTLTPAFNAVSAQPIALPSHEEEEQEPPPLGIAANCSIS